MSNRKLHITIIGGGIGGLTAAIALRRAGHSITVYEQSSLSHEVGQGITIAPNAGRILQRLGLDFNKARMVDFLGSDYVDATSLEHLKPVNDQQDFGQRFGLMMKTAYRIDLHAALLELARGSEGAGEPVRIVTAARVDRVNAEDGKVTFASGDTVIADLVVAVDGVKSSAAQSINGAETPVLDSTGTIVYRFTLSQEAILEEGTTNRLIDGEPRMSSFYVSAAKDRWVVRYCCRDDGLQNFALYVLRTHEEADRQEHALKYKTNRASLLEEMKGFHPALLKLAEMSTDVLPMWRCTTREPLSKLHRGRLVVLGDAAHPIKPHLGLGAVSAIEDAGVLGALFENVPEQETEEAIAQRLRLYDDVRRGRVAAYKYYSDVPPFHDAVELQREKCERYMRAEHLPSKGQRVQHWYAGFDAVQEADEVLGALSVVANGS